MLLVGLLVGLHKNYRTDCQKTWMEDGSSLTLGVDQDKGTDPGFSLPPVNTEVVF